jgi:HlyD family secretion protein
MRLVGGVVAAAFLIAAMLALSGCGQQPSNAFPGYMEADLVLVGPEQGGRVTMLAVQEGQSVEQGTALFTLESETQKAEVAAARARVAEAEARLADVKAELQRPGEIDVLDASLAQAKAMQQQAATNLERAQKLFGKRWVSQAQLDDAVAQHDRTEAAVTEAERRITAAKLPGRTYMIDAAAANTEAARHALTEAESNLAKRAVVAPAGGTVEEVYFRPGEVVNAGQAVLALLPPANLRVRFFVAEPVRAALQVDQTIEVTCDGCQGELAAKISFIAREAEFTPPVIFSQEQRKKLVFLVEARPLGATAKLTAGQPVTIVLGSAPRVVAK